LGNTTCGKMGILTGPEIAVGLTRPSTARYALVTVCRLILYSGYRISEGITDDYLISNVHCASGTTAEAMTHWHEVFGGKLEILNYRDTPLEDIGFEPDPDAVAHATLTLPQGVIAGGDSMDSENDYPIRGTAYSLLYTTETPEEAEQFIEKLRSGGSIGMPFQKAPWGDWYGQVFDRFGVMWAFSCEA